MKISNNVLSIYLHTKALANAFKNIVQEMNLPGNKKIETIVDDDFYVVKIYPVEGLTTLAMIKNKWNEHLNYIGAIEAIEQVALLKKKIEQQERSNMTINYLKYEAQQR